MEVILLQKVANLGNIGDKVRVKPGYGRNFLLPQGKAALATNANVAKFEERRAELERHAADELSRAQKRATQLENFKLALTAKAGNEGKLFGSRSSAAKCAWPAVRSVWSASTTSSCTCTRMSRSICRS